MTARNRLGPAPTLRSLKDQSSEALPIQITIDTLGTMSTFWEFFETVGEATAGILLACYGLAGLFSLPSSLSAAEGPAAMSLTRQLLGLP